MEETVHPKYNLDNVFDVQGVIKPEACLMTIINTAKKRLTKKDVVVLWGGTKYVGRNEATDGWSQLQDFVIENIHKNSIQTCLKKIAIQIVFKRVSQENSHTNIIQTCV
jgi:hypothetical protein